MDGLSPVMPRRSLLRGLASLPLAGTASALSADADPVFAAIEAHRSAEAAVQAFGSTEEQEAADAFAALVDAACDALTALGATEPATMAGHLALLSYFNGFANGPTSWVRGVLREDVPVLEMLVLAERALRLALSRG